MGTIRSMKTPAIRSAELTLLVLVSLICAGCTTTGGATDENEPTLIDAERTPPAEAAASIEETTPLAEGGSKQEEGEVPLAVAESEQPDEAPKERSSSRGSRSRHEVIHDLVAEAQTLLRDVELQYVFTGKGKNQVLRGRPVAFALWSDAKQQWSVAHIELPRPPIKWKPGGKPLAFRTLTPGIQARHVKGTGAERLMFAFSQDGDPLKVYGRKFPVFDNNLLKRKQWSAVVRDREADRLSALHRRHLRPGFRQQREGVSGRHGAQGDRGAASRAGAECGLSRRAARRCHSSPGHHDTCGHRADR